MSGFEIEVVEPGLQTTVQDYPGRLRLQAKGFFPAGPMDDLAHRAANLLVGNPASAAGLEIVLGGARFRFSGACAAAVCGADGASLTLNGEPALLWESFAIAPGDELRLGMAKGPGFRLYLAVSGGIDVPVVLGSRATYTMGGLGGLEGRALKRGDRLPVGEGVGGTPGRRLRAAARPVYAREWSIEAMRGPQADPDYLTEAGAADFMSRTWKVNHNSNRVGIRLEGDRWEWARSGGGVAGGHPSNILDDSYPLGGVNLNGDVPVILGPDGPTSGGFVVAVTVVRGALWKLGQMRPGSDTIRFREVTFDEAAALAAELDVQVSEDGVEGM